MRSGTTPRRRTTLGTLMGVALLATLLAPVVGTAASATSRTVGSSDPATWTPFVLTSASQFRLAVPFGNHSVQTRRELRRLEALQAERTPAIRAMVKQWNTGPATFPWTQEALNMILVHRPPAFPTRTARIMTLLHVAMYDAVIAAYDSSDTYHRSHPYALDKNLRPMFKNTGSTYPDVNSAIAGAAESMLTYLFPDEPPSTFTAMADQATRSRLYAGVNFPSDVKQGRDLGHYVAAMVINYGEKDGHLKAWDFAGSRLCSTAGCRGADEGYYVPTAPTFQWPPTDPMASKWTTWYLDTPSQFLPPPPPSYGSQAWFDQLAAVKSANDTATPDQLQTAFFWDDGPGTYSPSGHWNSLAMQYAGNAGMSTEDTARLFAILNTTVWDAFVAAWNSKYVYWTLRPVTAIRERPTILGQPNPYYDPNWLPNIATPTFPSYVSGHSTVSASAARVLQFFFPDSNPDPGLIDHINGPDGSIDQIAQQVSDSRVSAGIHYPIDCTAGLVLGREVARLALQRAIADGAGPAA